MEPRTLEYFADACQGVCHGVAPERVVTRICTDSREIRTGDLFVGISGDRFDGHDFVADALDRGAVAAVVARAQAARFDGAAVLWVDDPRRALGRMAARYRADFHLPVVAVAGSNGKTTTKELIGTVLGGCFETLRSPESFNNDVGVPATLFGLESRHLAAVVEVGTNHPGELAPLLRMAQPRLGVLTHVGEEHLEYFGSLLGVIEEEGWLADLLPPDGVLILPGDPAWSAPVVARSRCRVVRVGRDPKSDWRLLETETDARGTTFSVRGPRADLTGEYRVNLLGAHQVSNALLAAAAAAEFGLNREEIRRGLTQCAPARWRMNRWQVDGVEVIEDCYNANLDSTLAALETLRAFPCSGRRVAVLGGMAELGIHTSRAHAAAGRRTAELGIDRLLAIGDLAAVSAEAATDAGLAQAIVVDTVEAAASHLRTWLRPGDCLLIKGSRSAHLERLSALLRGQSCLQRAA
ncbi:MAG: UDP-N-acetylmuramoyl-tripeptide--D-alanyl-D-alanine ligase [Verrucomicrobiales bacterium]|nr:UDP-N-acetylmuramoyl-tripeptide--D-alanyl-D-alanine ligase [Verrucomicrobiales bacterium]